MPQIDDPQTWLQFIAFGLLALFVLAGVGLAIFARLRTEPERWK